MKKGKSSIKVKQLWLAETILWEFSPEKVMT